MNKLWYHLPYAESNPTELRVRKEEKITRKTQNEEFREGSEETTQKSHQTICQLV